MIATTESVNSFKPNRVFITVRDAMGKIKYQAESTNLRTNQGATFQQNQMSGTVAAVANVIGVTSTAAFTPAATDTGATFPGEQSTNGLARAAGTFTANTSGSTQYTVAKTFSYTGAPSITLTGAGLFNTTTATAGCMLFEASFGSSATLVTNDQITTTWTVNI